MTPQQPAKSDRPTELTPPAVPLSWGWKFAVFLWGTSLVFLTLYEILYTLFRFVFR